MLYINSSLCLCLSSQFWPILKSTLEYEYPLEIFEGVLNQYLIYKLYDGWMDGRTGRLAVERMGRLADEWTDGPKDRRMDGWTDGWM